ncbi:MAG: LacI family DNA-binding transcriptional regulator [Paracoccus sp. (in: a-proteobacteria)]|uniref:LacI family DNA-binding transcriptional regulator n=1 Tax=Paracoccus sp. TaxID=267 RepID=UPI0039E589F4
MQDIADLVGVSRAAVSNALRGKGRLSDETRRLILQKAEELAFSPSAFGRALRTGRSHTFALILPDFRMPLFAEFARAFALAAKDCDMVMTVADSLGSLERQGEHLRDMDARGVDAVVLVPMRGTALDELPLKRPLIVVDAESNPRNAVASDHHQGGALVAGHLADLGHREVLLLGAGGQGGSRVNALRLQGMRAVLTARGVTVHETLLPVAPVAYEAARDYLAEWQPGRVTAIAASYDALAVGALMALSARGIRVPQDISVTGFDDTVWGRITMPPLTTVRQDLDQVAQSALAHALGMRKTPDLIPVTLVRRGSAAAPRPEGTS